MGASKDTSSAAGASAADAPRRDMLSLTASASTEVTRDVLAVTFSTTREGTEAAGVQSALKQALDAALAEAKKIAKPGQVDVQTGNFSLHPRYSNKGGITGWHGTAELQVEGKDAAAIAQLTGRILKGPEFLTVFDGRTGRAVATAPYDPPRHPDTQNPDGEQLKAVWGDGYANRSDRYLAGVAYLDGKRPSIIMGRGYYARSTIAAWDYRGGKLVKRWLFDSAMPGNDKFGGQGNHQLSVADVDGDGRDEIVYGSMVVDDNGKGLWSSGLGHGDAMHVSDLDPARPGLDVPRPAAARLQRANAAGPVSEAKLTSESLIYPRSGLRRRLPSAGVRLCRRTVYN